VQAAIEAAEVSPLLLTGHQPERASVRFVLLAGVPESSSDIQR
jgi:hypothetical protein